MRSAFYLILCLLIHQISYAFTSPAEVAKLVELIELAKEELEKHKEAIKEVKFANDLALDMKDTLLELKEQHEYFSNFDPEAEIKYLLKDIEGLYSIKDIMNSKPGEERFNLILYELGQRLKRTDLTKGLDDKTKQAIEEHLDLTDLTEQRQALIEIKEHYQENAISARHKNLNQGDLDLITASSTAVLAADAVARQQEKIEEEIKRKENLVNNLEFNNSMLKFFKDGDK